MRRIDAVIEWLKAHPGAEFIPQMIAEDLGEPEKFPLVSGILSDLVKYGWCERIPTPEGWYTNRIQWYRSTP